MISSGQLLVTWILLLALLHSVACCSPKAVKSIFVGRAAAQAAHQAKKAKYLAGETKTIAEKMKLTKGGGIIMEQIDPKKLKAEIKYLESVEKTLKVAKKRDLKNAASAAKRELAGKAPKLNKGPKPVQVVTPMAQPLPVYTVASAVSPVASSAGAATKTIGKKSSIFGKKAAKHMEPPPAPPAPPPVASVAAASSAIGDVGKSAKSAGKKSGFFGGKSSKAAKPPEPPPRPPAPPPPPPPPAILAEEVMKKKKRRIFGRRR